VRCPRCQATNADGARFCGQCFTRFDAPQAPSPALDPTPPPAAPSGPPVVRGGGADARVGRFALVDGALTWRCAVCDTPNDAGTFACAVCGTRMDAESAPGGHVDWPAARRAEALVPGLGHLRAGHAGVGAARMALVALWLVGTALLALGGLAGVAVAVPLLVGAAGIWVTGPGDLDAVRAGRPPRLDGRGLGSLVVGVTLGVIVAGGLTFLL
jgi:hypothetical protein